MGFKTQEDQRRAVEAAALENAKRETIAQVYAEYQDFVRCEANERQIIDVIRRWTDYNPEVLPSKAIFDLAIVENPDELKGFVRQPLAVAKEQVIDEYIELLAAHSRQGRYSLQQERNRLNRLSLEVGRQKLQELKTRQKMAATDLGTLKQFVADAHRDDRPFPGWPTLPAAMWDGTKHVKVDADYLNGLAKTDIWQFKRLVKLYGSEQIDARREIK